MLVCRAEHGVTSTIRDLCFSPAHKDKVRGLHARHMNRVLRVLKMWRWVCRNRTLGVVKHCIQLIHLSVLSQHN